VGNALGTSEQTQAADADNRRPSRMGFGRTVS